MTIRVFGPLLSGAALLFVTQTGALGASISISQSNVKSPPECAKANGNWDAASKTCGHTVNTDSKGVATFGSLAPGKYDFAFSDGPNKGKVFRTITVTSAEPVKISAPVVVPGNYVFTNMPEGNLSKTGTPGANPFKVHVSIPTLTTGARVSGTANNPPPPVQGDPLPGIDVSMEQNPGGIIIAQGTTNGSGEFVFNPTKIGNYTLRFGDRENGKKDIGIIKVEKVGPVKVTLRK